MKEINNIWTTLSNVSSEDVSLSSPQTDCSWGAFESQARVSSEHVWYTIILPGIYCFILLL